jgi:ABC-type glycerol-3-phosphate transport system substrate-binding protein
LAVAALPSSAQEGITLPDQVANGEDVTITIAACIGEDQVEQRDRWDAQLARFMEKYPNVTLETVIYCFAPDSFAALVAGGDLPTLFEVPFTEPQKMIREGIAADLTGAFAQFGIEDVFNASVLAIVSDADGAIYGFPTFAYAQGLAYNIAMLEAAGYDMPPQTWAELPEVAGALAKPDEFLAGFAMNMAGGGGGWHYTNIAYGFGADIIKDNGDGTYTATFGEGPAVDAMQMIYDLRWKYNALPRDLGINPILELVADNTAMAMNPGDGLGWVNLNMPEVDLTKYGYAAVPAGPDGVRYSLTGGSARMVNSAASPAEQEAAVVYQIWSQLSYDELAASRELFHGTQAGNGAPVLNIFAGEFADAVAEIDAPYITMPVENYAAFNDAMANGEVTLVPEPVVAAQDWYAHIAEVLTTVLTDENADVPALMAESAQSFQTGILDQMQ